jgi:hypothetical protein
VKHICTDFDYPDALDDSDDWRAVMDHCGLRRECQDAILDPRFKDIRLTETASYWISDTVLLRLAILKSISRKSALRSLTLIPPHLPGHQPAPKRTSFLQLIRSIKPKPSETLEEATVLWKDADVADIDDVFPWCGHGHLENLKRNKLSDLCDWERSSITMYSSRRLAEHYARYSERRCYGHSPASLIKMSIPVRAFDNPELKVTSLSHNGPVWKKIVWHNRRGNIVIYKAPGLMIGPVSSNAGTAVFKRDNYEEMTEGK